MDIREYFLIAQVVCEHGLTNVSESKGFNPLLKKLGITP